ncbi:MAG: hypothetical protein ACPGYQ_04240, partial [Candidatus Puniceispirillales bacterium]
YRKTLIANRYPAVVTAVNASAAQVFVLMADDHGYMLIGGEIPFALADWAYPPRDDDGNRGDPITRLDDALSIGDVVVVQRPETALDRLQRHPDLLVTDATWALGQVPLVEGAIIAMDRILAASWQ